MNRILIIVFFLFILGCESDGSFAPNESGNFSRGGSTARFTISGEYLYTLDFNKLTTFHLQSESNVVRVDDQEIWWNEMETIFPFGDYLFIGSTTGILILSLEDPARPRQISEFSHFVSCDPVVVEGNFAYSTLRGGNMCGQNFNQLDIINISNITEPRLVLSYPLSSPRGLAINNGCLYVCDDGIKVLDVSNLNDIKLITHLEGIPANDVIFFNNQLLVTADDGFYQYNVTDCGTLTPLGHFDFF